MRIRDHEGVRGKVDAYPFDPRLLKVDPDYNIRDLTTPEARAKLDELKVSVRERGVRSPLLVRMDGDDCIIVEGHRRHTVVMELIGEGVDIETVLCLQEPKGTTPLDRDIGLVVSNSGEKLEPLEFANLIYRLITVHGLSEADAGKKLHKSVEVIRRHLELRASPEPVKAMVKAGEVSATTAVNEVRKNGSKATETLRKAKDDAAAAGKTKVTPKRLAQSAAPEPEPESEPLPSVREMLDMGMDEKGARALTEALAPDASQPWVARSVQAAVAGPSIPRKDVTDLIIAIKPIFEAVRLFDLSEFEDDETITIQLTVPQARAFDIHFAKVTGGES